MSGFNQCVALHSSEKILCVVDGIQTDNHNMQCSKHEKKRQLLSTQPLKFRCLSGWEGWGFSEPEMIDGSKETVCSDTTKLKHTWTHRNCGNFLETSTSSRHMGPWHWDKEIDNQVPSLNWKLYSICTHCQRTNNFLQRSVIGHINATPGQAS